MNHKSRGIVLSYLNLILGMVVNVFLTPMLIVSLGDLDYSLYKVMQSFAGPLSMFHLGISTVVTRSVVKCASSDAYSELDKKNTMALALLASGVMALLVLIAGGVMHYAIPGIYGGTYSAESLKTGQQLFAMYVAAAVLHMLTDAFSGCILGHERYTVSALIPLLKTVFKLFLLVLLLWLDLGVHAVVTIDLLLAFGVFAGTAVYAVCVLHEVPKLSCFDKGQLMEILSFGLAILLQAFVNQVNNNVDTMILGAFVEDKAVITMYSSALSIYAIYNSLISVMTHYFLPKATQLVTRKASGRELTDFVIGPGRLQAAVALACICGFSLFGRNFITIWIGPKYMDAYGVVLMLMIPVTIPLVQNAVISILDATMKRMVRSVVLVVMAVLNVIVSVILVRSIGFWGAALGTAVSLILGHGVLMNVYYAKEFGIEVFRMFVGIFRGILAAALAASAVCLPLALLLPDTVVWFVIKCVCFVVVYGLWLCLFGFNRKEKQMVLGLRKGFGKHKR